MIVEVEGIGVDMVVMIIHIAGLQGPPHHIEVAGIIHQGTLPMVAEGIGGIGLGHLMLHMESQIGGMLGGLGDILQSLFCYLSEV